MRMLALLLACRVVLPAVNYPASWRYAHPDTQFLMGVEWRRLMLSPVYSSLRLPPDSIPRPELLEDLDRVLISSPDAGEGRFLAILSGRFQLDELRKLATAGKAKIRVYNTVEIVAPADGSAGEPWFALVDPRTILAGDRASVLEALDRATAGPMHPPPEDSIVARARELAETSDIWIVAGGSIARLARDRLPTLFPPSDLAAMEAAISLREGLQVRLDLQAKTEQDARALAGTLAQQWAQQVYPTALTALLRHVQLGVAETTVRLELALTAAEMNQIQSSLPLTAPRPAEKVKQIEPDQPRVIRIVGLDDGPREIPFPGR